MRSLKLGAAVAIAMLATACDDSTPKGQCDGSACDGGSAAQDAGGDGGGQDSGSVSMQDGGTDGGGGSDGGGGGCTPLAGPDLPDPSFIDSDCDGIDGTLASSVFLAPDGDDANDGTAGFPVRTLAKAYAVAAMQGKTTILVGTGTYETVFPVTAGVNVHGGYERANAWRRTRNAVSRFLADGPVLKATNVSTATTLSFLVFEANSATTSGASSVAGILDHASTALRLEDCSIRAGNGADGENRARPARATAGSKGQDGGQGRLMARNASAPAACQNAAPTPGNGASGVCAGGNGGAPDDQPMRPLGYGIAGRTSYGQSGQAAPDCNGIQAPGGFAGRHAFEVVVVAGGGTQISRTVQIRALAGVAGTDGSGGVNAYGIVGSAFSALGYQPGSGNTGANGTAGTGGGGGGGAADVAGVGGTAQLSSSTPDRAEIQYGTLLPDAQYDDCFVAGGAGGGGGSGGAAGVGGAGGGGGGGSVALLLFSSTPTLVRVSVSFAHGGAGGSGAPGGAGGVGGDPGLGGAGYTMSSASRVYTYCTDPQCNTMVYRSVAASVPEPLLLAVGSEGTPGNPYNNGATGITSSSQIQGRLTVEGRGGDGGRGGNGGDGGGGSGGPGGPSIGIVLDPGSSLPAGSVVVYDSASSVGGSGGSGGASDNAGPNGYAGSTANIDASGHLLP